MKQLRYLLLTLVLLGGQFALLAHATDLHAHAAGEECQVCLHAPALDSGLIPAAIAVVAVPTSTVLFPAPAPTGATAVARPFDARGPPDLPCA